MSVSDKKANKLWKDVFGNATWARDCFGTWLHKDDHGEKDKKRIRPGNTKQFNYGWDVDHIKPLAKDGPDIWNNYEPMHWETNQQVKQDKISFKVKDISYQVVNCSICSSSNQEGYGIKRQDNGKRVDWKYRENKYYN